MKRPKETILKENLGRARMAITSIKQELDYKKKHQKAG
jgi:hypothetical protein